jgi:hypothetical protein
MKIFTRKWIKAQFWLKKIGHCFYYLFKTSLKFHFIKLIFDLISWHFELERSCKEKKRKSQHKKMTAETAKKKKKKYRLSKWKRKKRKAPKTIRFRQMYSKQISELPLWGGAPLVSRSCFDVVKYSYRRRWHHRGVWICYHDNKHNKFHRC